MGDMADMLLDGTCCSVCGAFISGGGFGVPRTCSLCRPSRGPQSSKKKKKKGKPPIRFFLRWTFTDPNTQVVTRKVTPFRGVLLPTLAVMKWYARQAFELVTEGGDQSVKDAWLVEFRDNSSGWQPFIPGEESECEAPKDFS